jgi:predicted CXXCH cytochrome family protein
MNRRIAAAMVLTVSMILSVDSYGDVRNSRHDLTIGSPGPSNPSLLGGTESCIYCHAPHSLNDPSQKPLWNRTDPVTTNFTMYGTTIDGTVTDPQPNTPSLHCLSCHDGVTAVDAYGGSLGTPGKILGSPYNVGFGGDLSRQHPVSISALTLGGSIGSAKSAGLVFYDSEGFSRVECPTCHDPHLTTHEKFLRISNNESALCQTCHSK